MFKKIITNGLVLLATFIFVFIAGEIICRIIHKSPMQIVENFTTAPKDAQKTDFTVKDMPDSLYQFTPEGGMRLAPSAHILLQNHYLSHKDINIDTNSLGFRSPEVSSNKGNEYRVLVLGDSITLGDYVEEPDTYPSRTEKYLKEKNPDVRVINAGIGSADINNEYRILLDSGLKTSPDMVVLGLYLNDGELSANFIMKPLPGILKKSYFANWINRRTQLAIFKWKHRDELAGKNNPWVEEFAGGRKLSPDTDWTTSKDGFDFLIVKNARDWGSAWNPKMWGVVESKIIQMKELSQKYGFKFAVVLFPVRYQVEADYLYNTPQQIFDALMQKMDIPHLDLLPILRTGWKKTPPPFFYFDKCHLTTEANDLVGKNIADFVNPLIAK